MVDCFHHIPCASCPRWWDSASEPWRALGFTCISVPRSAGTPGRLGKFEAPGWEVLTFANIRTVLEHFARTNFVLVPGWLGRERVGAPMGDALSGAALRLFKWDRESACRTEEQANTVHLPNSLVRIVHLHGSNALILDTSFRNDMCFSAHGRKAI